MPDIPILNNIKGKIIPFLNKHQEYLEEETEIVKSPGPTTAAPSASNNDVLRQFRIAPETELNEDILTPSKVAKVRFRESSPRGFSHADVEQFHRDVSMSLQWYIKTLEQRDKDIHRLATEIDKYITDYQNLRFEIEVLQSSGGQAVVDGKGNYVTESQLSTEQRQIIDLEKSVENLNNKIVATEKELLDLRAKHNETVVRNEVLEKLAKNNDASTSLTTNGRTDEELATLDAELAVYRQWEKDVTIAYEELEASNNAKEGEIAALTASLEELKANPLVVEPDPIIIQAEPVIIENREELDAALEQIRVLEEANEQFKTHAAELDAYIDVLLKSIEENGEDDETEEDSTEEYEPADDFLDNSYEETVEPTPAPRYAEEAPKIVKGIDIGNLPPGIRPDDLF